MTNCIKQHREESQSTTGHMHHTAPTALVTLRALWEEGCLSYLGHFSLVLKLYSLTENLFCHVTSQTLCHLASHREISRSYMKEEWQFLDVDV